MRYRPTPLNILSAVLIGFSIYSAIRPGPFGFGFLALFYLVPIGVVGLVVDFLIQKLQKNYFRTFAIELLIIGILALGYSWTERTKTLIIPDNLSSNYIVTIYGIDTAPKLPLGLLTWNYSIKFPENGILLTSSDFDKDLPDTEMKTYAGQKLNSKNTEMGFISFSEDEIKCDGKTYKYRSWMIDSTHCCVYSNKDVDSLKIKLQNIICGESPAGNIGFRQ